MTRIDWVALVSTGLIGIFAITLLTSYMFPIYPDEIQARFWLSRLPYDFPEKIGGAPICVSTFSQPLPATMYVPGWIDWVLHGNLQDFHALRLVGLMIAILWVAGLAYYFRDRAWKGSTHEARAPGSHRLNLYTAGFFIAVFSVGVFPIFLILNRGDQFIPPSLVLLLFLFLASNRLEQKNQPWQMLGLTVMYFVAVSLVLSGHGKGLFLTPLLVMVGWRLFRRFNNRPLFVFATALLGWHVAQAYSAFKYAFQCSEVPAFAAELGSFYFDPASLFYDPRHFFDQAYHSLLRFEKYLDQLSFQSKTDIGYLPSLPLDSFANSANIFLRLDFAIAFFAIVVLLPVRYYRNDVASGRFVTINATLLILLVCSLASAIFNLPKNWYDAGYLYALLAIIWIFFIGENFRGIFQKPIARMLFLYLGCTALLSQAVFIHRYLPAFWDGYAGPGISIVNYDHEKALDDLTATSRICGIDPVHSKGVIVDDYTYLYYQKSKQPIAFSYVHYVYSGKLDSIARFLSEVDSSGLVTRCRSLPLPASYRNFTRKAGDLCCISGADLKNLSSP